MANPNRRHLDLVYDVFNAAQKEGVACPLEFLVAIMAGRDPRAGVGELRKLVMEAEESEVRGRPSAELWGRLKDLVLLDPRYSMDFVFVQDSQAAAKELLQYMYSKRKAVHVSAEMNHLVTIEPLTAEEAQLVDDELFDEF